MTTQLTRRSGTALAFALALAAGTPAHAQRPGQVAPNGQNFVTGGNYAGSSPPTSALPPQNYGNGYGGFNYGGYPFNGYGNGYGYGNSGYGYGGYGGGYGGYGGYGNAFGGYNGVGGYGNNYGGFGSTIGVTNFDVAALQQQQYMLSASQSNLANAQAMQAYQAANLYNQQAMNQMYSRYAAMRGGAGGAGGGNGSGSSPGSSYQTRYNMTNGNTVPYPVYTGNRNKRINRTRLAREQVLTDDGKILWPKVTPTDKELDPLREAVDTAFHDVAADRQKNKRGHVTIRDAVHARGKLMAFAVPAVEKLSEEKSDDLAEFQVFLGSLDFALRGLANASPVASSATTNPDNTPESGGNVLKDSIQSDDASARPAPAARTTPENTPKSGGDVLKETLKEDKKKD